MKVFHKQLTLLLLVLGLVFGSVIYYAYSSMDRLTANLAEQSVHLLVDRIRSKIDARLNIPGSTNGMSRDAQTALRQSLVDEFSQYPQLEEFFVVRGDSDVLFSFNPQSFKPRHRFADFDLDGNNGAAAEFLSFGNGYYEAYWRPANARNLLTILGVNATAAVSEIRYELTKKVYVIGIAGVVGIILIAFVSTRVVHAPLKKIERAMVNIDKRKYGYRIKGKQDDEFRDIYEKVNIAMQRLEQLDSVQRTAVKRKNNLITELRSTAESMDMLAHEVKNPLHAMVVNIDVLKTKVERGRPKAEAMKHVKVIEGEIDHLKQVVEGFLRYLRPNVPQKERLQINDLVKDVCQMAAVKAEKSRVKIETRLAKGLRNVMVDREQFREALHNLIINAIHASSEGSKIMIRTWAKRDKVLIAVKDEGTGISKDELEKIFELYFTTKKEGSGIGLPVTKRLIEANGGELQLESAVGKGTTATIIVNAL